MGARSHQVFAGTFDDASTQFLYEVPEGFVLLLKVATFASVGANANQAILEVTTAAGLLFLHITEALLNQSATWWVQSVVLNAGDVLSLGMVQNQRMDVTLSGSLLEA